VASAQVEALLGDLEARRQRRVSLRLDQHDAGARVAEGLGEVARAAADVDDDPVEQGCRAGEPHQGVEGDRPVKVVRVALFLAERAEQGDGPSDARRGERDHRLACPAELFGGDELGGRDDRHQAREARRDDPGEPLGRAGAQTAWCAVARAEQRVRVLSEPEDVHDEEAHRDPPERVGGPEVRRPLDGVGPVVLALLVDHVSARERDDQGGCEREPDAKRTAPPRERQQREDDDRDRWSGDGHGEHRRGRAERQ
jgi:hypothetical protein